MKFYIYQIWFPTSKKNYIGQTCDLQRRMEAHLKSDSLVCRALWKYDDWQITIMHTCLSQDAANRMEIEDIRNHNSVAPNGYNLTRGGDGIFNPSKETREKMRVSKKGNQNAKGYKHTEEYKQNLSKRLQGNKYLQGYKPTKQAKLKEQIIKLKNKIAKLKSE